MVLCELHTVIERDGFWREGHDGRPKSLRHIVGVFAIRITHDEQESGFTFDGGDEVVFLFFEVHEVGLPVVIVVSVVDVVISFVNRDSALYFTSMFAASPFGSSWFLSP